MADCVFPEDIMLCILTRLPVKSILRFKSVCKPWRELFHTSEFVKMHQGQFSSDPKNQSVIFYQAKTSSMYVLNIIEKKPTTILDRPYPEIRSIDIVGCCNGLICLGARGRFEHRIVLWNPALKLYKFVGFSGVQFGDPTTVSLGFGFDGGDFKVVRFIYVVNKRGGVIRRTDISGVEVYSANSDSWTTIEPGFQFLVFSPKNDLIVNGNPYWVARVDDGENMVLMCFDVTKMVFKIVPLPAFYPWHVVKLVDWEGNLGAILCTPQDNDQMVSSLVDVWVFDDGEQIWRKKHTFGPIQGSVLMLFKACVALKNGNIVGERTDGKRIVFDPANRCVEEIVIDEGRKRHFEMYGYNECLTRIKGMKQVKGRR